MFNSFYSYSTDPDSHPELHDTLLDIKSEFNESQLEKVESSLEKVESPPQQKQIALVEEKCSSKSSITTKGKNCLMLA